MNLLTLSWKNLLFRPLSLVLNLSLFALGIGLIAFLLLFNHQLQDKFEKNLAGIDLVIGAKGSPLQLILCNMYHIDAPTGNISLREATPFLNPRHPLIKRAVPLSLGDNYKGFRIAGTTPAILDLYNGQLAEGTLWTKDFDVTLGAEAATRLHLHPGDSFSSAHGFVTDDNLTHDQHPFHVCGILKPTGTVLDELILTTTASIWKVHDRHAEADSEETHDHTETPPLPDSLEGREITSLLIQFKGTNYQTLNMQRSINENTDMQAATPAIEINRLYLLMGWGTDALQWLAILITAVSGLSIFVSLLNSLKERKYELALMRVMGASRTRLFLLLVLEGLLIALMGYCLGLVISHAGMEGLARYLQQTYRYRFTGKLLLPAEAWLLGGALLIGFLAALWPAYKAYRADISRTLGG